jgi:hypothetical protein
MVLLMDQSLDPILHQQRGRTALHFLCGAELDFTDEMTSGVNEDNNRDKPCDDQEEEEEEEEVGAGETKASPEGERKVSISGLSLL